MTGFAPRQATDEKLLCQVPVRAIECSFLSNNVYLLTLFALIKRQPCFGRQGLNNPAALRTLNLVHMSAALAR